MKIKKRLTPEFEMVEVELPMYLKSGGVRCHYWKIFDNETCLHVLAGDHPAIEMYSARVCLDGDYVSCTKDEFNLEYNLSLTLLNSKL